MPAYPVQKKRKLSNEATEPTKLHKKAAKASKVMEVPRTMAKRRMGTSQMQWIERMSQMKRLK
jgi:hypothetical protein